MKKKTAHVNQLNVMIETACAEFGSALEMMAACKNSNKETFAFGYFEHAKDEYDHTNSFLSMLAKRGEAEPPEKAREYRFSPTSLIPKGYVSQDGYLIETMHIKDFIAYVYTNELLAKNSFDKILNLVKPHTTEGKTIQNIMNDELRHHGLAEKHFLKYYPRLQPWQLRLYQFRETIKNHGRKFYDKNLKFLDKVLTPVYHSMAFVAAKTISLVNLSEFDRKGINLMDIQSKSVV